MMQAEQVNAAELPHADAPWPWWRVGGMAVALCALTMALFSLAASVFLLIAFAYYPELNGQALSYGLLARIIIFFAMILAASYVLIRFRPAPRFASATPGVAWGRGWLALPILLLFGAALVLPNLAVYPWAAPDEIHHLNVAKNLAVHGKYASGDPQSGFRLFDPYDSVGAPVIVPVAAAFRLFGVSVAAARYVIAGYYLLLMLALFCLARPVFGTAGALVGVLLAETAFSSIYLGRTLYGEVPALCWLALGLLAWRRALAVDARSGWGLLAGAAFGLAVLCKTIFIFTGFAFLGVLIFDLLHYRRMGLRPLLLPAAALIAVLGAWWFCQTWFSGSVGETAGSTVGLYRHYLLFGWSPAPENLWRAVLAYPGAHLVLLAGVLFGLPALFDRRYDPAMAVLLLVAAFFAYWWLFFTPGQIPRYLWPAYAVSALPAGALAAHALQGASRSRGFRRLAWIAAALCLLYPAASWICGQVREVYFNPEMRDDYAVAAVVCDAPSGARVATNFYPLRPALRFLADRAVDVNEDVDALLREADIVIVRSPGIAPPEPLRTRRNLGVYWVLSRTMSLE